jgi:hypothetical protein
MPLASWRLNGLAKPSSEVATGMYVQNSVTSTASQSVTIPTVQNGDVGIFFATCTTTGNSGTTPSGWTLILQGSLNYSYRVSYKTLTSADSGTTLSSGIATGTRSNILLIVRGQNNAGADAVIPTGYSIENIAGETTTATPTNRALNWTTINQGALAVGMWASNGTITARGFTAFYGNTPSTPQLNEYSSNVTGINLYVKALTSYPSLTGANTTTRRDNITYNMADYGSNGTLVFNINLNQSIPPPSGGSRTAYVPYSPYKTNSPALTTANYKFGTASLNCQSGISPIRSLSSGTSPSPGAGAYTIEWWAYQTAYSTNSAGWFDMGYSTAQVPPLMQYTSTTNLRVIANSATVMDIAAGAGNSNWPSLNNWHHYALVREGRAAGQTKLYFDGVLKGTGIDAHNLLNWGLTIGGLNSATDNTGSQAIGALIDEFRISNIARYTAAFTPPTAAFTNDANTLGLWHFNGADGSYYFPDDNT